MATWLWVVIVIVVAVVVFAAAMMMRRRRTAMLRERFGAEYDRTMAAHDDQHAAEAELRGRQREHARLEIRPLPEASRVRHTEEWRAVQASFVDEPAEAVAGADELLHRVMGERGYPMRDFDAQADLVSVDHPDVVENYRIAHSIHQQAQQQQARTEDLREALLRYRSLFEELLRPEAATAAAVTMARAPGSAAAAEPGVGGGQTRAGDGQGPIAMEADDDAG
jgi:hypothetical protein